MVNITQPQAGRAGPNLARYAKRRQFHWIVAARPVEVEVLTGPPWSVDPEISLRMVPRWTWQRPRPSRRMTATPTNMNAKAGNVAGPAGSPRDPGPPGGRLAWCGWRRAKEALEKLRPQIEQYEALADELGHEPGDVGLA
jgi:hypothetical protein